MANLADDVAAAASAAQAAVDAVKVVEDDVTSAEPTFADKVLAAVQPVFEAEGWTAPAPVVADTPTDPNAPDGFPQPAPTE